MNTLRLFLAAALAAAGSAHALTLPVAQDTSTTTSAKVAKSAGKATTLPISQTRAALLRFNVGALSGVLPSANVASARLTIYITAAKVPGDLAVRPVLSEWSEVFTTPFVVPTISPGGGLGGFSADQLVAKRFATADVTNLVKLWLDTPANDRGLALNPLTSAPLNVILGAKEGSGTGYPAVLEIETLAPIADSSIGSDQLAANLTLGGTTTGTFTGNITGNVSGSAASFTGSLGGDVTGTQSATVVGAVGGVAAADVAAGVTLANDATNAAVAGAIVKRDANGGFSAGTISLTSVVALPTTASASTGVLYIGGNTAVHTFGTDNFFGGNGAGNFTMNGGNNTGVGAGALKANTNGSDNNAFGRHALFANTTGTANTALGSYALEVNVGGTENVAVGFSALSLGNSGNNNVAVGSRSLASTSNGTSNTAVGWGALNTTHAANENTAVGYLALANNDTGSGNIALGANAGKNLTTGSNNIHIGNVGVAGESNTIRLGDDGNHTKTLLVGDVGIGTDTPGAKLEVNGDVRAVGNVSIGAFPVIAMTTAMLANGETLTPTSGFVQVTSTGGAVTLNTTTPIANGSVPGQILILQGVGSQPSNYVTVPSATNVRIGGNINLFQDHVLTLLWDGNVWLAVSYKGN